MPSAWVRASRSTTPPARPPRRSGSSGHGSRSGCRSSSMSKPPKLSLKSIVAASVPSAPRADAEVVGVPAPPVAPAVNQGTLKERAKQLSVYLEPAVYDQLRDLAYTERTKIHPLMLEALDLLFSQRGARSIRELEGGSAKNS